MSPNCAGAAGMGEESHVADAAGPGVWQSLGGQISSLGQWGNSQARGLAPSNGPGHTRGVNRRQRRSPIGAVQGLLGVCEGSPEADAHGPEVGPGVLAGLRGVNLHPWPLG